MPLPSTPPRRPVDNAVLHSMNSTPAHVIWHTPELLTSILYHLKPTDSSPQGKQEEDRSWMKDVARVLRTSQYGLQVGAAVLYESERNFPKGSWGGRYNLRGRLEMCLASQARIKFYMAQVKRLDYREEDYMSNKVHNLKSWLIEELKDHPSVSVVHFRTGPAFCALSKGASGTKFGDLSILQISGSTIAHMHKTIAEQVCPGGIDSDNLTLSSIVLGTTPDSGSDPDSDAYTTTYLTSDTLAHFFSIPKPPTAYSSLNKLDISIFGITWTLLGRLLSVTPALQALLVKIHDRGTHPVYDSAEYIFPKLGELHVSLGQFDYPNLPFLTDRLTELHTLRIEVTEHLRRRDDPPFTGSTVWADHRLGITSLTVAGFGIDYQAFMGVISKCPALTSLQFECRGPSDDVASNTELEMICKACPNLWKLDLAAGSLYGSLPFIETVNTLTSLLENLVDLTIPVRLPSIPTADSPLTPIRAISPRWPRLQRLDLHFIIDDLAKDRPDCLLTANFLARLVRTSTALQGTMRMQGDEEDLMGHPNTGRYDQWWRDVSSMITHYRKELEWTEDVEVRTPGWRMMEAVAQEVPPVGGGAVADAVSAA